MAFGWIKSLLSPGASRGALPVVLDAAGREVERRDIDASLQLLFACGLKPMPGVEPAALIDAFRLHLPELAYGGDAAASDRRTSGAADAHRLWSASRTAPHLDVLKRLAREAEESYFLHDFQVDNARGFANALRFQDEVVDMSGTYTSFVRDCAAMTDGALAFDLIEDRYDADAEQVVMTLGRDGRSTSHTLRCVANATDWMFLGVLNDNLVAGSPLRFARGNAGDSDLVVYLTPEQIGMLGQTVGISFEIPTAAFHSSSLKA